VLDADGRDFLQSQSFGGFNAAMTRQDPARSVNHDGPDKTKTFDAFCELIYLTIAVHSRVSGIPFQLLNPKSSNGIWEVWFKARRVAGGFACLESVFQLFHRRKILRQSKKTVTTSLGPNNYLSRTDSLFARCIKAK
jgi:hypothetical protein